MTYTSEEVQDRILFLAERGIDTAALAMLTAYADLLEQLEQAEPVAEIPKGRPTSIVTWLAPMPAPGTKLYTHPGADRLVTTNPAPHAAAPSTRWDG